MIVDFYHLTASRSSGCFRASARRCWPAASGCWSSPSRTCSPSSTSSSGAMRQRQLPAARPRAGSKASPSCSRTEPEPANGAANIALADGRWREEALGFARAFYFFDNDGRDAPARPGGRSRTGPRSSAATGSRTSAANGCRGLEPCACDAAPPPREPRKSHPKSLELSRPWRPNAPSRSSSPTPPGAT